MLFNEAYAALKAGKYMMRAEWKEKKQFLVLFPHMMFIWQIIALTDKPNAGVWMASVHDMDADDWMEVPKEVSHVCDVDPA